MANPLKGEVDFAVGEKTYTLVFTTNAMVEVETACGGAAFDRLVRGFRVNSDLTTLRALFWGSLRRYHPDLSLLDAGDMIDEIPLSDHPRLGEALAEAIRFRLSGAAAAPAEGAGSV